MGEKGRYEGAILLFVAIEVDLAHVLCVISCIWNKQDDTNIFSF